MHLVVDAISSQRLTDRQTAIVVGSAMYPVPPHLLLHYVIALWKTEEMSQYHSLNMGMLCLQRAMQSGAFLGTSEMLLFQIMQGAKVMSLTHT